MSDELLPDPIEVMERAAERIYESDWYEQAIQTARKQGAIEALDEAEKYLIDRLTGVVDRYHIMRSFDWLRKRESEK